MLNVIYIVLLAFLVIIGIICLNTTLIIIAFLNDLRNEKGLKSISINPIEKVAEIKEKAVKKEEMEEIKRIQELESEALSTMLDNIEKYDGTGTGQNDVPEVR